LYIYLDRTSLSRIYKNQIWTLVITTFDIGRKVLTEDTITNICSHVFIVFTNLRYLNIASPQHHMHFPRLSFENRLSTFFSSTLMELHINLANSNDCLYLLDGRFKQLRVLYVNIAFIYPPSVMINNKVDYLS
jgi:hypothetical protein